MSGCDLLFKYFLDLNVDAEGFDHSTFSKNRNEARSGTKAAAHLTPGSAVDAAWGTREFAALDNEGNLLTFWASTL